MLPDQPAFHGEHQHQRVLGDRDRVGAAVIGDGNAGEACRREIHVVVTGAQQLHQSQARCDPVERGIELHTRITDDVGGLAQRRRKLRALTCDERGVEAGRRQFLRNLADLGRRRHHDDPWTHRASPLVRAITPTSSIAEIEVCVNAEDQQIPRRVPDAPRSRCQAHRSSSRNRLQPISRRDSLQIRYPDRPPSRAFRGPAQRPH